MQRMFPQLRLVKTSPRFGNDFRTRLEETSPSAGVFQRSCNRNFVPTALSDDDPKEIGKCPPFFVLVKRMAEFEDMECNDD